MSVADHASKGGSARAAKLTPEARKESARAAARARWDRAKQDHPTPAPNRPNPDRNDIPDVEWDPDVDVHLGQN